MQFKVRIPSNMFVLNLRGVKAHKLVEYVLLCLAWRRVERIVQRLWDRYVTVNS